MAIAEREPDRCTARRGPPCSTTGSTTVDHKKIGIMYFLMAVVFLVIGGAEALVMRVQLLLARVRGRAARMPSIR